jgi:hypothetical protein
VGADQRCPTPPACRPNPGPDALAADADELRVVQRLELLQERIAGLLRALERFDPERCAVLGIRDVVGPPGDAAAAVRARAEP